MLGAVEIGHLTASCVKNIHTKNYHNLITGFQVTAENVGDAFFEIQCIFNTFASCLLHRVNTPLGCIKSSDCMQQH